MKTRILQRILIYAMLLLGAISFLMPLLLMISTGLKPIEQTMSAPPTWIPYKLYVQKNGVLTEIKQAEAGKYPASSIVKKPAPRWSNYAEAIKAMKMFPRYLRNTLILCVLTVIGTVISSSLAAYGFSRIEWRGRNGLFVLALATMMVPFPVTMVPIYSLFRWLGWIGTLRPLWVGSFFAGAFNVFLLRQFFMTLPKDLSEAARIDGCSEFRIFWQIILPLCKPALMVVGLFQFMYTWNDFMGPLIYLTNQNDFTLALGLQFFQSQTGGTEWHYLMAASTLVALPIIVLFFFTQKTFIEGISMTGIKG
jgi:multiple sugar transport system permease protein